MKDMKKVNFHIKQDEDGYPPVKVESVWAKAISGGLYEVDNIPFFTRDATVGDRITVRKDEYGNLWFREAAERSTHSLIRVVFFDRDCIEDVIKKLREIGCNTERMRPYNLVAVDVPDSVSLEAVQDFLELEYSKGRIDYEEALLRQ